ncbi:hypothetical protein CANTEDRAFT_129622 [Yamadazyma tenuis ATCC 10573]|uniref:Large ribosomal subunit protein uL15/eL18 domain-containing protein n=1 Tax=Candida tenuis (strain ATCC 10573 / BCRC 21748 / CBS 615 / JCM 9827 / NBRC 10315 / NRRL Y-1498 / VKM Y-70) TaxID=590646 RepID=G3B099_CANTC|nr:uncharacterized protein CANTEDRAFT_129622 [Yamadazyma tenuis ATCC 10573]EGV65515.1 hypothetical protein CANTEDRAFT_129622 [Yamadazyma tenuis ATCC 10573]
MLWNEATAKKYIYGDRIRAGSSFLGSLAPIEGAVVSYKRLGRGQASGKGKTSGRGQKGQKARGKVPKWFEGGQTPFYKRFPIIGFKRPHRKEYNQLNLERIQEFWDNNRINLQPGELLTIQKMRECGLVTGSTRDGIKILGNGKETYTVPIHIEASRASIGAIKSIEKTGHEFTAKYFTKLGLKAHINPDRYILKKGYLPLQARPTHRRDIEFYSNPHKRGYLLKDPSLLLAHRGQTKAVKKVVRKSYLSSELEAASDAKIPDFAQSTVLKLSEL